MTLLLQIKYATPDNANNIGLTFSPKNQLPQIERKGILSISVKTHETYRKLLKSMRRSFVKVYSYNDCTITKHIKRE